VPVVQKSGPGNEEEGYCCRVWYTSQFSLDHNQQSRVYILKKAENLQTNDSRIRLKSCRYEDVEEAVLKWIDLVHSHNVPLSEPLITEKAIEFAKRLN